MKTENEKNYERAAYHESGHIVLAYLSGYSCDSVELLISEPGTAKTKMNYNEDLILVASIMNSSTDPDFFNELSIDVKRQSPGVAHRIATILLSGSATESAYNNNGAINGNMEVEISGPDLDRVNNVDHFLSQIKNNHSPNYIQETLQKVLAMLSIPEIWNTICSLSNALLEKPNKKLDKIEIEAVLHANGYFDNINKI